VCDRDTCKERGEIERGVTNNHRRIKREVKRGGTKGGDGGGVGGR